MQLFSFFKKDFVKNVLTLLSGSTLSQVIIYLALLCLTRLFSTEVFGIYMLFSSTVLILKPIVSLQLELAILLPKRDKDAINVFSLSIITLFVLNLILLGIILVFEKTILLFFEIEKLSYFIYFIPLSSFLFGCITSFNYWNNRIKSFNNIAKGNVIKASFLSSAQITTGLSSFKQIGLIPGMILGQLAQLCFLLFSIYKTLLTNKKHLSSSRMLFLLKRYKDIPVYNTILTFLNTLSNEIPIFMITKYFGLASGGIYGLAIKIGRAPAGVIHGPISQVFFNKASESYNNNNDLKEVLKKTFKYLFKISLIIFIPILILSFFLDILFGEQWLQVGLYLRILIPWLLIMFLSSPISSLIVILNKQKTILFYDILLLIFRFSAFYIGYTFFNNVLISLMLFSAVGVLFNIFILAYFFKISHTITNKNISYQ